MSEKNNKTEFTERDAEIAVWDAIRKTINKFRKHPYYFFTESDIHAYFYHALYSTKFEVLRERDNKRIYGIHREYPTNFRYERIKLLEPECIEPYPLEDKKGDRGHYDIAILNPEFIKSATSCEEIINKNVKLLEEGSKSEVFKVLFAIECKYIINNSKSFINEVLMDNKKLLFAMQDGSVKHAINLVFCNIKYEHGKEIIDIIDKTKEDLKGGKILTVFIQSYYDENNEKKTPKPIANYQEEWDIKL